MLVRGAVSLEYLRINYLQKLAKLRKDYISFIVSSVSQSQITQILARSILIPLVLIIRLRYFISQTQNSLLATLTSKPALRSLVRIALTYSTYSLYISLKISMLLRQADTKRSKYSRRVLLINNYYIVGALYRPNGITIHLKSPLRYKNTISYSQPLVIRSQLNIATISSFIEYFLPFIRQSVSLIKGIGYLFLIVRALRAR